VKLRLPCSFRSVDAFCGIRPARFVSAVMALIPIDKMFSQKGGCQARLSHSPRMKYTTEVVL
jgi:hypothetical protein